MKVGTIGRALGAGALGVALAVGGLFAPGMASAAEQKGGNGQISLALAAGADTASQSDGVDTYTFTVVNRGGGEVKNLQLSVPIAAGYRLAGATFTQSDAWVTANSGAAASITVEQLRGVDDTVVGTLTFVGPGNGTSNALAGAVTASWKDSDSKAYSLSSNLPGHGSVAMSVSAASVGGAAGYSFAGAGFASNEPVTFWYTNAAGVSTPLVLDDSLLMVAPADDDDDDEESYGEYLTASEQGAVSVSFATAGLPAGAYTLAARGNWSGVVASAAFMAR
jgi:hypothetical protein